MNSPNQGLRGQLPVDAAVFLGQLGRKRGSLGVLLFPVDFTRLDQVDGIEHCSRGHLRESLREFGRVFVFADFDLPH